MADTSVNTIPSSRPLFITTGIQRKNFLKKRWVYHILFWILYYSMIIGLFIGFQELPSAFTVLQLLVPFLFPVALAYFNIYFLIPRLLFAKKYLLYAGALFLAIITCSSAILLVDKVYAHFGSKFFGHMSTFTFRNMLIRFLDEFYLVGLATGVKFLKDSIFNQQWMKEKEKHYLETELNFLKSQINPHFFFNTLNNLYSLTLKKSDLAPEIVLKLSALMSYMLYDSNEPLVPLEKEISYLQNYIDVEKLRFGGRLSVTFSMQGKTEDVSIPPMILILFIENSFKHGVKNNISKIDIDISLKVENGFLYFQVKNPAPDDTVSTENVGIGLKNGRRRLDLLYRDRYSLDILIENKTFIVSLKIPLC